MRELILSLLDDDKLIYKAGAFLLNSDIDFADRYVLMCLYVKFRTEEGKKSIPDQELD